MIYNIHTLQIGCWIREDWLLNQRNWMKFEQNCATMSMFNGQTGDDQFLPTKNTRVLRSWHRMIWTINWQHSNIGSHDAMGSFVNVNSWVTCPKGFTSSWLHNCASPVLFEPQSFCSSEKKAVIMNFLVFLSISSLSLRYLRYSKMLKGPRPRWSQVIPRYPKTTLLVL